MRADDDIDIVAAEPDAGQRIHDIVAGLHGRRHQPREPAPARFPCSATVGVAAGIEQHIALGVVDQRATYRQVDGLTLVGVGHKYALAHAQTAAGEQMHLHRAGSVLPTTARIALTMCS